MLPSCCGVLALSLVVLVLCFVAVLGRVEGMFCSSYLRECYVSFVVVCVWCCCSVCVFCPCGVVLFVLEFVLFSLV